MNSIVHFTSLSESKTTDGAADFFCSLLEIDEAKILIDCGVSGNELFQAVNESLLQGAKAVPFRPRHVDALISQAKEIDAILLSNADIPFIGGLPHLIEHLDQSCYIFSTVPTQIFTKIVLDELSASLCTGYGLGEEADEFGLGIAKSPLKRSSFKALLDRFVPLRFYQSFQLPGRAAGIAITPYPSGNLIGGAMWRIRKGSGEDILYAMQYSHRRNEIIEGAKFDELGFRPSIAIMDSRKALCPPSTRVDRRDGLLGKIAESVSRLRNKRGSLFIYTDCLTRFIELAFILDKAASDPRYTKALSSHAVVVASWLAPHIIENIKGLLEWTSEALMHDFETSKTNPFSLTRVQFVSSVEGLDKINRPFILVGLTHSFFGGNARDALVNSFASNDPLSVMLLSEYPGYCETEMKAGSIRQKVPLSESELSAVKRRKEEIQQAKLAEEAFQKILAPSSVSTNAGADDVMPSGLEFFKEQITSAKKLEAILWVDFKQDLVLSEKSLFNAKCDSLLTNASKYSLFTIGAEYISKAIVDDYGGHFVPKRSSEDQVIAPNVENMEKASPPLEEALFRWKTLQSSVDYSSRVSMVDFSCFSDGKSVRNIISQLNPRKVLFIGGAREDRLYFENFYRFSEGAFAGDQLYPDPYVKLNVSSSLNICQALFSESNLREIAMQPYAGFSLGRASVFVRKDDANSSAADVAASFQIVPAGSHENLHPVVIGDIRLTDLRRAILENFSGTAEIDHGRLIVDEKVHVSKDPSSGCVHIEGPYCDAHFAVKSALAKLVVEL